MPRKAQPTIIEILRDRERKRRLVPALVLRRRRVALAVQRDDPGLVIMNATQRLSNRHAKTMRDLMVRSMALKATPDSVANLFVKEGLDGIKLDGPAQALINNAINKVSEVLIFKLVATELVNDPVLRDEMVDLFLHQRFDAMRKPTQAQTPQPPPPIDEPPPTRRSIAQNALLEAVMSSIA